MKSPHPAAGTPEWRRLQAVPRGRAPWRHWGPYLSERGWGTVREDYSAGGDAWRFFPFDHARSRAYRWNEDGLGGICDDRQTLCLAFAFWNGADPFLKERIFGLYGHRGQPRRGRQGVLVVPGLDTHPLVDALALHVPAVPRSPTSELVEENARRGRLDPEYELVDTGIFDTGPVLRRSPPTTPRRARRTSWSRSRCATCGPETADLHVLPHPLVPEHLVAGTPADHRPEISAEGGQPAGVAPRPRPPPARRPAGRPSCSSATTRPTRTASGAATAPAYPKDGINDHVVAGAPTVHPGKRGTKAALWYRLTVAAGETGVAAAAPPTAPPGAAISARASTRSCEQRRREADAFFAALTPAGSRAPTRRR